VYYQGKLNQTLHYFSSAIVDNKTSKILEVCEYTSECNAQGAGSTYGYPNEKFDVADGITYVVGRWSESGAGVTSEPAGYMYDIQASISYKKSIDSSNPGTGIPSGKSLNNPNSNTGGSNTSQPCAQTCVADPINTVTGEFWLSETDAHVQSLTPLIFTREYGTSKSSIKGSFGYGWNSNYDIHIKSANSTALSSTSTVVISQENGSTVSFTKNSVGLWTTDVKTRATLQQINGKFVFTRNKKDKFVFNTVGQLETISDLNNNTLTFAYVAGKLTTVSNGKGQQLSIVWGANNLIKSVTTPGNKITQYAYTTGSDLSKVTYPDASSVSYSYSNHLITSFKDPKGGTTKNIYDDQKRVTQQTDAISKITTISYDIDKTVITNPNGREDHHYFNNLNQVYHIKYDASNESYDEYYEYDAAQNLISTLYPNGSSVEKTYDTNGNPLQVKDRAGNITTYTYNTLNQVLSETDAAGSTRRYSYDSAGNLTASTDFNGNSTSYSLNSDGTTAVATAPDGSITAFSYNPQGLITQTHNPLGQITQQTFTLDGYLETATDELGLQTTYSYDSAGLVNNIKYPNGYSESVEYDANGNIVKTTNRLGKTSTYTYDLMNRELTATDASSRVTKKTYDSMGNVTRTTDASLKSTNHIYDNLGQLLETTDARSKKMSYSYDEVGNLITVTDAKGHETHFNYDANSNIVETVDSNNIRTSTQYDTLQRPIKTVDAQRKNTTYSYDANSNLLTKTLPNLAVETNTYNNMDQRVSFLDSENGLKKWTYDTLGQQTSFINTDNLANHYTYDAAGNLKTETRPDNSTVSYDYQYNQLVQRIHL
jgi:YD repeat-containing protein